MGMAICPYCESDFSRPAMRTGMLTPRERFVLFLCPECSKVIPGALVII